MEKQLSKRQMQTRWLWFMDTDVVRSEYLPAHPGAGRRGSREERSPVAYTAKMMHCIKPGVVPLTAIVTVTVN